MTVDRVTNKPTSPLRYPGGKGKITRFIDHLLDINSLHGTYIEPFAGGAGIATNLLLANKVDSIIINDKDDGVYYFWNTLVTNPSYLIRAIKKVPFDFYTGLHTDFSSEQAHIYWHRVNARYKSNRYRNMQDKAVDFFLLNRMNVSGIIDGGPIGGINQVNRYNITSRFNKKTLISRIEDLADVKSRIHVENMEASFFFTKLSEGKLCNLDECFVFADPPYYEQGKNLYTTFASDRIHELVAEQLLSHPQWKWILTYDVAQEISELYKNQDIQTFNYNIAYSANKRGQYDEFMFADTRLKIESFDNVELSPIALT
ncbi:DNA adenine methylase [Gardnerella sp. Marseille-QA0894]|uniref:DNA adenine methylase n=1 Tax=Gardnerella sp. Marseille-QA0894 TaxID=3383031 RepID=UPI003AF8F8F2